jgi:hypothetical protein
MLDDHEGMGVFDCLAGDEEYSGVRYVIFFQVKVSSERLCTAWNVGGPSCVALRLTFFFFGQETTFIISSK